ncbi:MAG: branched chain amino acid aminotransferase, partial [Candidatus Kapabacteria bacterium]|nr:branched chain amino acid aminotransferase [Candidatus Kapabacteria bacterium]
TKPLRVKVEREFTRAAPGGTGYAKCAGNYAAAMYPTKLAQDAGFDQVIWTDAKSHEYVEESGTMNLMFFIDGALVTPPTGDTILKGITRESIIQIARDLGYDVVERPVSVDELGEGIASGRVTEAFGAGTAASVAPIETISIDGQEHKLKVDPDCRMYALKSRLNDIRFGRAEDVHGWMTIVDGTAR